MAARTIQSKAHTEKLGKLLTFAFHEGLGLCFHSQPSHQFLASKMNVQRVRFHSEFGGHVLVVCSPTSSFEVV